MIDIPSLLGTFTVLLGVKILLLALIFVYIIFCVILVVQARAFNRIVYIGDSFGSLIIQVIAVVHLLTSISLFLLALAIL